MKAIKIYSFFCKICNKSFSDDFKLQKHLKKCDPQASIFHCKYCNKRFVKRSKLKIHEYQHEFQKKKNCEPKVMKVFSCFCEICHKSFSDNVNLRQHLKKHVKNGEVSKNFNLTEEKNTQDPSLGTVEFFLNLKCSHCEN